MLPLHLNHHCKNYHPPQSPTSIFVTEIEPILKRSHFAGLAACRLNQSGDRATSLPAPNISAGTTWCTRICKLSRNILYVQVTLLCWAEIFSAEQKYSLRASNTALLCHDVFVPQCLIPPVEEAGGKKKSSSFPSSLMIKSWKKREEHKKCFATTLLCHQMLCPMIIKRKSRHRITR